MRYEQEVIYKAVGGRIKTRRREMGMTQEQLAQKLEISRASLANIETGRQSILLHNLYSIAMAIELRPEDLLPAPEINGKPIASLTTMELPDNLNSEQKRQIEKMISSVFVR